MLYFEYPIKYRRLAIPMSTKPNLEPEIHRPLHVNGPTSTEELLRQIFQDLADNDSHDVRALLRGVAAALQIAATTIPDEAVRPRKVWNHQKREAHRSRVTWESWLLLQKLRPLRDKP
jgi:hypothetical protein